jgi:hypothetical protein
MSRTSRAILHDNAMLHAAAPRGLYRAVAKGYRDLFLQHETFGFAVNLRKGLWLRLWMCLKFLVFHIVESLNTKVWGTFRESLLNVYTLGLKMLYLLQPGEQSKMIYVQPSKRFRGPTSVR